MPFPVIKLAYLVVKQVSKPLAAMLKSRAKTTPWLRNHLLIRPAQWYHRVDTGFRLRLLGLGKTKEVKPLNEEMAVDLGADMLGELFIFSVGAGLVAAEYWRQSRKEAHHESTQDVRLRDLEQRVLDQGILLEQQSAQLRELDRLTLALTADVPKTIKDSASGKVLKVQK